MQRGKKNKEIKTNNTETRVVKKRKQNINKTRQKRPHTRIPIAINHQKSPTFIASNEILINKMALIILFLYLSIQVSIQNYVKVNENTFPSRTH